MIWLLLPTLLLSSTADLTWEPAYEAARTRSTAEGRVMFVAVHADEEARSEAFWKRTYKDKTVRSLAEETVNLLACRDVGGKKRCDCAKAGGLDSEQAKFMEAALREEVLVLNAEGIVASPQHLWLDSKGAVLLCVPFEMTAGELAWCFGEAARLAGGPPVELEEARAPRRLLYGQAFRPAAADEYGRGLRPDELKEKLAELKSGGVGVGGGRRGGGRGAGWGRRLATLLLVSFTDEKEAQEYVANELRSGWTTWAGPDVQARSLHTFGVVAPKSAWPTFEGFADHRESVLRNECAVAIEQAGFDDALKTIKTALKREKEPSVRKNWLRALGAVAGDDKGARRILLEFSEEEDPVLRRNATFALGWLPQEGDVSERLSAQLTSGNGDDACAAACAMALSRDQSYLPELRRRVGEEGLVDALKTALEQAIEVIEGGDLAGVEAVVSEVCRDQLARERVFFRSIPIEPPPEDGRP